MRPRRCRWMIWISRRWRRKSCRRCRRTRTRIPPTAVNSRHAAPLRRLRRPFEKSGDSVTAISLAGAIFVEYSARRRAMKNLFRVFVALVLLGGWALAASALYVVRSPSGFVVITKDCLGFRDTYVDVTGWDLT